MKQRYVFALAFPEEARRRAVDTPYACRHWPDSNSLSDASWRVRVEGITDPCCPIGVLMQAIGIPMAQPLPEDVAEKFAGVQYEWTGGGWTPFPDPKAKPWPVPMDAFLQAVGTVYPEDAFLYSVHEFMDDLELGRLDVERDLAYALYLED